MPQAGGSLSSIWRTFIATLRFLKKASDFLGSLLSLCKVQLDYAQVLLLTHAEAEMPVPIIMDSKRFWLALPLSGRLVSET